ncbi:MAG TPA: MFS transporter [Microscillaceae bacterium]|nr:MFS transporter [Microscillaceae bacterium]
MITKNKNLIKATLLMASSLTVMAGATIAPLLPLMSKVFKDIPHAELLSKLALTLPSLMIALVSPLAGYIIDKFGRIKLLLISLILYAVGGTSGLYLTDLYAILAGRAILGIAVAGVMTTATTLIADYLDGIERNKFMSLQGAAMALGGMVFVGSGGILADVGWRYPFALYFFSLVLLPLAFIYLFEPQSKSSSQETLTSVEGKQAIAYPKFLVNFVYIVTFVGMIMYYLVPVQLPYYVKELGVQKNALSALAIAVATFMGALGSFSYRRVKAYLSFTQVFALSFGLMGTGLLVVGIASSYNIVLVGMFIGGLGAGYLLPNPSLWMMSLAPERIRGRLIGRLTMAVFLGHFFSPVLSEPVAKQWSLSVVFGAAGIIMIVLAGGFIIINHYIMSRDRQWHQNMQPSTTAG